MATNKQTADLKSNIEFTTKLMADFKQKNIDEGINAIQAMWLHERIRSWTYTFSGITFTVDIMNMAMSGDIQTAYLALLYGEADDMTDPKHWLSSDRKTWLTEQMRLFLGW